MKTKQTQPGFTLIEILLVLVLLSLTAVAVIATIPTNSKDVAKKYAQSFYQRVLLLNEEAILSGLDFGVRVDEKKSTYVLMALKSEGWQEVEFEKIPSSTELPEELALSLTLGGGVWEDDERLFNPGSLFDEDMFADLEEEKKPKPPQIYILSSAEMTPFVLSFYPNTGDTIQDGWRIRVLDNGVIRLLEPGEEDEEE
ncbi:MULTISPECIES: prepilin-type N-terminal cleavage/methylation domain-containing protein [Vibrio]|uniref:Prepilin-type N-terminal cleavage/methylation domain-containing protein n=1 Tax=Vibrio kanaloae TaxID=170673 RepID=A0A4U1YZ55_9VIBR|nr:MULTISPECIES: prepilin-type N-terminal cleavage/methylation domain-containing protein [Vibrio]KAB0461041.1 prepilin-type N-terminal cleavage/methylation domain-containing protein [Vibrio kanaloae]TKF25836.1 prepilin-type N-terminal cleavage/methylation domain-containing protein [Vibrio kanaloae]TKF80481.1 prepilin-type N-terminal cleavage/methylation domain-containing protein [Vibrio kanaloae]UIJ40722.1 GspH/FimT family pseudopilin [Vibrio kanaloae]